MLFLAYDRGTMSEWVIYAFLAALAAAVVGVFSKIGIVGVDPTVATTIRGVTIALTMGIVGLSLGKFGGIASIPTKSLIFIVLTGVAGGLSWLWGFMALRAGGDASLVNAIDRLSLVMLVLLAALFLGEKLTWAKVVGALIVSFGVLIMTTPLEVIKATFTRVFS
jgi:transporter family protein